MNYDHYTTPQNLSSAGVSFVLPANTLKMSIEITGWQLASASNRLALYFSFNTTPGVTNLTEVDGGNGVTMATILSSPNLVTTVNLLQFAVADGVHNVPVGLSFHNLSTFVITFPSFSSSIAYDPDFSVLLLGNSNSNGYSSSGGGGDGGGGNNQLLGLIALAAIPLFFLVAVVVITVAVVVTLVARARYRKASQHESMVAI